MAQEENEGRGGEGNKKNEDGGQKIVFLN